MNGIFSVKSTDTKFYDMKEVDRVGEFRAKSSNGKTYKNGRIYVPESWIGKRVLCLLLDELPDEENQDNQ